MNPTSENKRYLVRTNCELSIVVEASSEQEALKAAEQFDWADWDQAWAENTAEEA